MFARPLTVKCYFKLQVLQVDPFDFFFISRSFLNNPLSCVCVWNKQTFGYFVFVPAELSNECDGDVRLELGSKLPEQRALMDLCACRP